MADKALPDKYYLSGRPQLKDSWALGTMFIFAFLAAIGFFGNNLGVVALGLLGTGISYFFYSKWKREIDEALEARKKSSEK